MSSDDEEDIRDQAARWHLASAGDAMDWDGFTQWLEADPRHRQAYEETALADALLAEHRAILRPEPVQEVPALMPRRARLPRRAWAGAAIAATLVAVLAVPRFLAAPEQIYTTGGSGRTITLADGSAVMLAPHSRLAIAGRGQQRIALSGGALFDVRHNPGRQLAIAAGELSIRDIGTRFDVQAEDGRVRVAVAEGQVEIAGEALDQPVQLAAGRGLLFDRQRHVSRVAAVDHQDVGSWRQGRLTYDNAPLALVAADLTRYSGSRIAVPDALGDRKFSGTLTIGDGDAAIRDLAQVLGLRLRGRAGAWRLELPDR